MKDLTVIFDLDGTMIDTAPDLIAATNYTLNLYGMAPANDEIIKSAVAYGAIAMIRAAMNAHGREPDDAELAIMIEHFLAYYTDHISVYSRPFPGLSGALEALGNASAKLGVCTNKREGPARKLLGELKVDHFFDVIAGRETFGVQKPDGRHILRTIAAAKGSPAKAVMIGDSLADANAARDANVGFIAVSFGYGEPFAVLKPDAVIDSFHELIPTLQQLLSIRDG
jgi:phosphoglycolate phosphatase